MKKKLFADPDPEEARKFLRKYFAELFTDDAGRGVDEEAARSAMFDKLTELEHVIRDVKKRIKRG